MPAQKRKQPLGLADANAGVAQTSDRQKPAAFDGGENAVPSAPAAKKARVAKPKPDPLDVSGVELDYEVVPVYDTCDTVRRKIRAHLRKDGVTQAAFLRAITATAFPDGRRRPAASSFNNFLKLKGPLAGNANAVFYAAYVFFEKLRIKEKKPKSKDREVMEERWSPGGVDIERPEGKNGYWCRENERPVMDKYGTLTFQ